MVTLVFGIGYIGSRLVQELLFQGREVVGFDNFYSTDWRAVEGFQRSPGFRFIEGSITDPVVVDAAISSLTDVDSVYLLAAQSSAHREAAPAALTEEVNLRGPRLILEALTTHRHRAPVVFASSTRVYGSPLPMVVDERSPYGRFSDLSHLSKCYVEKLLEMVAFRDELVCRVVRIGLTYGVSPVMKTDHRFMTAPNLFCLKATTGMPLEVRTNDAVALAHVEDAARGLLWAAEHDLAANYEVYNLATEVSTIGAIARKVAHLVAERELPAIEILGPPAGEESIELPRVASRLTEHGFVSTRSLDDGLHETFDHFLVNQS